MVDGPAAGRRRGQSAIKQGQSTVKHRKVKVPSHQVCLKPGSKTGWTSERSRVSINCLRKGSEPQLEAEFKSLLQHISEKFVKFTLCEKMGSEHLLSTCQALAEPLSERISAGTVPAICTELRNTAPAPAIPERQAPRAHNTTRKDKESDYASYRTRQAV